MSTTLAGFVAARLGDDAALLTLSAAAAGAALFWLAIPETRVAKAGHLRRSGRVGAMRVRDAGRRQAAGPMAEG